MCHGWGLKIFPESNKSNYPHYLSQKHFFPAQISMPRDTEVGLWLLVTKGSDVGCFFFLINLLVGQEARSSLIKNLIKKGVLCSVNTQGRKCVCSNTKAEVLPCTVRLTIRSCQ